MEDERRSGRAQLGCALGVMTLLAGVLLGVWLTLSVLGVGFGALLGRVQGQEDTPPLAATQAGVIPTPAVPAAIQGEAAPGRRLVWQAPIALDSDTAEPDLLVISRNYDREPDADTLVYLSPDRQTVRWESPPLGENGNSWVVAYGDSMVLVADDTRLVALRRDSGELAWEAPLTDSIADSICSDCLQIFGDVAVALPQDGLLQAFSVTTGAPRWNVRLREPTRQLVRVGERLGVPDSRPDEPSYGALYLYEPSDGSLVGEIVPSCTESGGYERGLSYFTFANSDPQGRILAWLVPSSPICLVAYDVASGTVSRTMLDEFDSGELTMRNSLWAGDTLYLSDSNGIIAVGPQELRLVLADEDYDLRPLAASGGLLLVEARRTRGSSRYELWAVDAQSGERRWERTLVADDPAEYRGDTGDFTATIWGDAVAIVEQDEAADQVLYELIGLADGASRARTVVAVNSPGSYIRGVIWGRNHVFLSIDELYGVAIETGQMSLKWP